MTEMENEKDRLEARLSKLSKSFALKHKIAKANTVQIAKNLPPKTALLELARVETNLVSSRDDKRTKPSIRYIAFTLRAGNGDEVGMIDLGDADKIDRLIARYRKGLYESSNGNVGIASETSKKLYDLVFNPLLKNLGDTKEIFISPDGILNLLPFEVLQQPDGKFLIQKYTFNYLSAGRDLLGFTDDDIKSLKCLLMGSPDFDLEPSEMTAKIKGNGKEKQLFAYRSADLNTISFEPLRYAKAELESIRKILGQEKTEIYTGKDAQEEILKEKSGYQFVHLATHGFFLDDQDQTEQPVSGRGWQTADLMTSDKNPHNRIKRKMNIENPLLKSGILLAGARRSLTTGVMGENDGVVTAEKILGMNFQGTKMVVLSACDTGLGEVKSGEGVFGLRRAFTQAGAKSLVMSLWKVPDRETKELMVQFYKNIKSGKMNRCQALRQAALKEMKIVKKRHGWADPRYWGAFVFIGEP